jgi:hypothetical protein
MRWLTSLEWIWCQPLRRKTRFNYLSLPSLSPSVRLSYSISTNGTSHLLFNFSLTWGDKYIYCEWDIRLCPPLGLISNSFPLVEALTAPVQFLYCYFAISRTIPSSAELEVVEREPEDVVLARHWTDDGATRHCRTRQEWEKIVKLGCSKDQPTFATEDSNCTSPWCWM